MIRLLLAAAALLLVASLPIAGTAAGKALRRGALLCFVLALAPAVLFGLLASAGRSQGSHQVSGASDSRLPALGFLILSPLAYGILSLRRRFRPGNRDAWAEYIDRRAAGKKPVDPKNPNGSSAGPTGLFGGTP